MSKKNLERYKIDQNFRLVIFGGSFLLVLVLALVQSPYATQAFYLLAGLIGGSSLQSRIGN
jgi:hypothetical protein